jgi:hypothetical protein
MASLPDPLREEVVASKAITTLGILSKAMLQYYTNLVDWGSEGPFFKPLKTLQSWAPFP